MKALFVLVFVVLFSGSAMAEGKDNKTRSEEPWGSMIEGLQYNMGLDIGYMLALDYVYKNGIDKAQKELCNRNTETNADIMSTIFRPYILGITNISDEQIQGINRGLTFLIYELCKPKQPTKTDKDTYAALLVMLAECDNKHVYTFIYGVITGDEYKPPLTQRISLMKLLEASDCKNKHRDSKNNFEK